MHNDFQSGNGERFMEPNFWEEAWKNGQIGFHQSAYNKHLVKYYDQFNLHKNDEILVPLCGKTLDMNFLLEKQLCVTGVELVEEAILEYLRENKISTVETKNFGIYKIYSKDMLSLYQGDFHLFHETGKKFKAIFDRASMIALPPAMREIHAKVLNELTEINGKIMLITLEYDQAKVDGPPHSIQETEVQSLFKRNFEIHVLKTETTSDIGPKFKNNGINHVTQKVYMLTKRN